MRGIKDRVAIIGMGCSRFGKRYDYGVDDLLIEACHEALADAGIEVKDIQAGWLGIQLGGTGQPLASAIKTEYIPISRVENSCATGTEAIRNACHAVAAGTYDVVIAAGVDKLSDMIGGIPGTDLSPVPPPGQSALYANRYFYQNKITYEEGRKLLAMIDVKNRRFGAKNPKAQFQEEITIEDAVNAPTVAYPLGMYDCSYVSDGAGAAIITRADLAKNYRKDYVLLKGIGSAVGGRQGQVRDYYDFTHIEETQKAASLAYEGAGLKNPREELDLAVVHDASSMLELLAYEDLGWSPRGGARADVESGFYTAEGGLPVNTDGGLVSFGHSFGATGIRMVYEIYKQLQGKAGARQVKNARLGLTHNLGGAPGNFVCGVTIWGAAA